MAFYLGLIVILAILAIGWLLVWLLTKKAPAVIADAAGDFVLQIVISMFYPR